jgi:Cu/Ag efflux protein CusF
MARSCAHSRLGGTALLVLLAATTACRPAAPPGREFDLRGHVLDVDRARSTVLIRHHDIPGFVPALTMPFRVKEVRLLDGRQRGDLVKARPWPEGQGKGKVAPRWR